MAEATADANTPGPVLQWEIEQFLYAEAALLDELRFDDWLALLTDDIHYYMPTRRTRLAREADRSISAPDEVALFDEDKQSLALRVRRLHTGMAWAEEPASRTRHLVSNVRVSPGGQPQEYRVQCNWLLYRSRLEREVDQFVGTREDLLRRADNALGWQIARRHLLLDQTLVLANNLSIFF